MIGLVQKREVMTIILLSISAFGCGFCLAIWIMSRKKLKPLKPEEIIEPNHLNDAAKAAKKLRDALIKVGDINR